jgi:hypothetical protein
VAGPELDGSGILDWIKLIGLLSKRAKHLLDAIIGDVERHKAHAMDRQQGVVVELVAQESVVSADDGEHSCDCIERTLFLVPLCSDKVLLTVLVVLLGRKRGKQLV